MKKILILLLITLSLTTYAQKNYSIERPLYLGTVNEGTASDSVLVRGADKIVKFVPRSEFGGGTPPAPTIQQVIDASPNPDGYGASLYGKKISFDNEYSLFKRKFIVSAGGIDLYKYTSSLYDTETRVVLNEDLLSHQKKQDGILRGYELRPLSIKITSSSGQGIEVLELKWPTIILNAVKTLPISVNGNDAGVNGNIELSLINTTFTTNDGKTVTVTNGVITNVQ